MARKASGPAIRASARRRPHRSQRRSARGPGAAAITVTEIEDLRRELERVASRAPLRWNADPDQVQQSLAQLVLTLVEFVRQLLERQAVRRLDAGTLTDEQAENVGRALMNLETAVRDMAVRFGLDPKDLNLELGPLGKLL